jgi:dephospho-CoA kinase
VAARHSHRRRSRRHRRPPIVVGLTGSVAMGKSTAAAAARFLKIPVLDSDAVVHQLMGPKGAATKNIAQKFPKVVGPEGVDRAALGNVVFIDKKALQDLEAIVHPLVRDESARFFQWARTRRAAVVVHDIPLLFETGRTRDFDFILVVSAPAFLQRQRALRRPGMTEAKLAGVLARQMPDRTKRFLADAVIPSGLGKRETLKRIRRFLKSIS